VSHSKDSKSRDGKGIFVLVVLCTVVGIGGGTMLINYNEEFFERMIYAGGAMTVLGIGYGSVIKNAFRVLLFMIGGLGLGLMLRGFAAM